MISALQPRTLASAAAALLRRAPVGAAVMAESASPAKRARHLASALAPGYEGDVRAKLHYSRVVPGKRIGRYINTPDAGELADEHSEHEVDVKDARQLPGGDIESRCFELRSWPSAVKNFEDDAEMRRVYYPEMEALVKAACGAERVILFDHTVRDTGRGQTLNAAEGAPAAAAVRVHTDYSDESGPRRVRSLAETGGYTGVKLSPEEKEEILGRDFCIVNVWRSIDAAAPVGSFPLAVLDPSTLDRADFLTYEMQFPERKGENFALRFNAAHRWYYYPSMAQDECLVFKTWESRTDRPRYCFHTAFSALSEPADARPRRSVEIRAVAIMPKRSQA